MTQKKFENSFRSYSKTLAKQDLEISGTLGIYLNGERLVDVPNRPGYVYVQLRDNLSEVIQAFNEEVSVIFGLAVIVIREGNRYVIKGRDTQRYNNWNSTSSFVPAHANQHAFNPDGGGGGDILWVQGRQIVPLGAYPSGTKGSAGVMVYPYQFREDSGTLVTFGATGTGDLIQYRPTDNTAIMGTVYIDTNTGNPNFILNSGSFFTSSITGTQDIVQYLPSVSDSTHLLVAGIRLVSGTSSIGWDNIYDLRQWHSTSAGGGGGGTPGGADTQVQFNDSGAFGGNDGFVYHKDEKVVVIGSGTPPVLGENAFHNIGQTVSPANLLWATGDSIAPFVAGLRARGDLSSLSAVQDDDVLFRLRGRGYDGSAWSNTQAEIDFVANGNWTGSNHGTDMEFYITPSGTTTKQLAANLSDNGINLPTGTTYNVGGVDIIPELISQAEAEAGTSETERIFSALRVAQAIDAQTPAFTAFTAYTPSYTNLTIGNAVVTARYTKIGTLVVGTVEIIFGTTTSVSGSVYVSLPSTPNGIIRSPIAICTYLEAGVAQYTGLGVVQSGSVRLKAFNVASTYAKQVDINASIPFTWGTGDQILFEFYYEE
jgi:hypothetical protein